MIFALPDLTNGHLFLRNSKRFTRLRPIGSLTKEQARAITKSLHTTGTNNEMLTGTASPSGAFKLHALAPDLLRTLVGAAKPISFQPNEKVFEQEDEATSLYLVRHGTLEVSTLSTDGRKHSLNILKKGDFFGEIALLDGGTRSATVTALEPTRLLTLSRTQLLQKLAEHPVLGVNLLALTVSRLRWVISTQEDQAFQPLEVRIARRLIYLISVMGDKNGQLAMSQSDLADHVGVSREAASKCLAEWQRQGLVTLGRRKISITDQASMATISQG